LTMLNTISVPRFLCPLILALLTPVPLDAQWGAIVRLSQTDSASLVVTENPLFADGTLVLAVWSDVVSGRRLVYSRSTDSGATWLNAQQLTATEPSWSALQAGQSGVVHCVYTDRDSGWVMHTRSTNRGISWTVADTLGRAHWNGDYHDVDFAANGTGAILCLWRKPYPRDTLYGCRSGDDGATWLPLLPLVCTWDTVVAGTTPWFYRLGRSLDSDTITACSSSDEGKTWSQASTVAIGNMGQYICASDAAERLHVSYLDSSTGESEVYYTRSTDHGATWSQPTRLTISSGATLSWLGVRGDAVYVSYCIDGTWRKKVSTDGGATWGAESTWPYPWVGPYTDLCAVSLGGAGRIHLLRYEWGLYNNQWIEYRRSNDFGGTWPDSAMLSDSNSLDRYPRAVVCDGNDVHVLWEDYEYGNYEIMYRRGLGLAGIEEEEGPPSAARNTRLEATVARGVLSVPISSGVTRSASPILLNATGRKLADLHPGANDVSYLAPGVYFVRDGQEQAQAVRKVIVSR